MSSTPPLASAAIDKAAIAATSPRVQSAARWFWWIAALSVINSVVVFTGGTFNFVLGLAVTQIADAGFRDFKILAVAFDLFPVAFFVAAGLLAKKGQVWAFVVGGVAYLLDGIIFAVFSEWLAAAFHAYALFCIFSGFKELRERLRQAKAKAAEAPPVIEVVATPVPAEQPPSA